MKTISSTRHHPRLVVGDIGIDTRDKFPCLHVTWLGKAYTCESLSIDLIPARQLEKSVMLPRHNFLPVSQHQEQEIDLLEYQETVNDVLGNQEPNVDMSRHREQEFDVSKHQEHVLDAFRNREPEIDMLPFREPDTDMGPHQIQNSPSVHVTKPQVSIDNLCPPSKCEDQNVVKLYTSENNDVTVFSKVENGIILSLSIYIIEGYRLAKAIRIFRVIQTIVPQLIRIGVTSDIHVLIKSYMLKTCVFYLTQNHVSDCDDIERNNRLTWSTLI